MSLSTNKRTKSLDLLLSEAVFFVRDVLPALGRYGLLDILHTDWYRLCKFDEPVLATWIRNHIASLGSMVAPAQRAQLGAQINDFFRGDRESLGIRPIHVAITAGNTSMLNLILDHELNEAQTHTYDTSYIVNNITGEMHDYTPGMSVKSNRKPLTMTLTDFAVLSGSSQILEILIRRNIE